MLPNLPPLSMRNPFLTRESLRALADVAGDAVDAGPLVLARVAQALVDVDLAQFSCQDNRLFYQHLT